MFPRFPVLPFPPLRFGPVFSSPAFSTPAIWSHVFQSCVFQSRVFSVPGRRCKNAWKPREMRCSVKNCQFCSTISISRFHCHIVKKTPAARRPKLTKLTICCRRRSSAAHPPIAAAAVDRWDRQTDKRTPNRFDRTPTYNRQTDTGPRLLPVLA